jgi:hypothetical protein
MLYDVAPGHSFDMDAIREGARLLPEATQILIFLGLLIGFGVKMPIFPLHGWLPLAHVEAPSPVSILLSGILLKMGSYGLLRAVHLDAARRRPGAAGGAARHRPHRAHLRGPARLAPDRPQGHDRLLLREPHGGGPGGHRHPQCHRHHRGRDADGGPWPGGGGPVSADRAALRADPHPGDRSLQLPGAGHAALRLLHHPGLRGRGGSAGDRRVRGGAAHADRRLRALGLADAPFERRGAGRGRLRGAYRGAPLHRAGAAPRCGASRT